MNSPNKYTIIKDTREKDGWNFEPFQKCEAVINEGLKTGDYTLEGLEEILCIERKASAKEIAISLGKDRKRFEAELERMRGFRWAYIVCEFSIANLMEYPAGSGIPKKQWKFIRMNGKFMLRRLREITEQYEVPVLFCDSRISAQEKAMQIFDEVTETLLNEEH